MLLLPFFTLIHLPITVKLSPTQNRELQWSQSIMLFFTPKHGLEFYLILLRPQCIQLAYYFGEIIWLCKLCIELKVRLPTPPTICCDNISAIYLASNPIYHALTKHVEVDYHFIRELVTSNSIIINCISKNNSIINCISTYGQTGDIFTKPSRLQSLIFLRPNS